MAGILQCVLKSKVLFWSAGRDLGGERVRERGGVHGMLGGGCVGQERPRGGRAAEGVFEDA